MSTVPIVMMVSSMGITNLWVRVLMVICQENRIPGVREMTSWTEEDLDTLRHESHHLVQDCRGGDGRGDNVVGSCV